MYSLAQTITGSCHNYYFAIHNTAMYFQENRSKCCSFNVKLIHFTINCVFLRQGLLVKSENVKSGISMYKG